VSYGSRRQQVRREKGEERATEREERGQQSTPIRSKTEKERKRREKTAQSFAQTKQEQEPCTVLTSSSSLSSCHPGPSVLLRPPSRIRRNSLESRARLLRARGIAPFSRKNPTLIGDFEVSACEGGERLGGKRQASAKNQFTPPLYSA
jgi:hypothetical protein